MREIGLFGRGGFAPLKGSGQAVRALKAAGIIPGEKVHVLNESTGNRLETYVIAGNPASGVICLNGPAARLGFVGDRLIILSYGLLEAAEARAFSLKSSILTAKNKIKK